MQSDEASASLTFTSTAVAKRAAEILQSEGLHVDLLDLFRAPSPSLLPRPCFLHVAHSEAPQCDGGLPDSEVQKIEAHAEHVMARLERFASLERIESVSSTTELEPADLADEDMLDELARIQMECDMPADESLVDELDRSAKEGWRKLRSWLAVHGLSSLEDAAYATDAVAPDAVSASETCPRPPSVGTTTPCPVPSGSSFVDGLSSTSGTTPVDDEDSIGYFASTETHPAGVPLPREPCKPMNERGEICDAQVAQVSAQLADAAAPAETTDFGAETFELVEVATARGQGDLELCELLTTLRDQIQGSDFIDRHPAHGPGSLMETCAAANAVSEDDRDEVAEEDCEGFEFQFSSASAAGGVSSELRDMLHTLRDQVRASGIVTSAPNCSTDSSAAASSMRELTPPRGITSELPTGGQSTACAPAATQHLQALLGIQTPSQSSATGAAPLEPATTAAAATQHLHALLGIQSQRPPSTAPALAAEVDETDALAMLSQQTHSWHNTLRAVPRKRM